MIVNGLSFLIRAHGSKGQSRSWGNHTNVTRLTNLSVSLYRLVLSCVLFLGALDLHSVGLTITVCWLDQVGIRKSLS